MRFDGAHAETEFGADFLVGVTARNKTEHFDFARRQFQATGAFGNIANEDVGRSRTDRQRAGMDVRDRFDKFLGRGIFQNISACARSEEHTSELQSQSNLVCRLLLEKKKKKK